MMNSAYFQTMFAYNTWAHERVWGCVMQLNESQFQQEIPFSWRSIHAELVHNMWAEWLYLQRLTAESPTIRFAPADFPTRDSIQTRWQQITADWKVYIDGLQETDLLKQVTYADLAGNLHTLAATWQLLAHLLNHSTTHRVTTLAMIDLVGGKTVDQDLIYYLREKA